MQKVKQILEERGLQQADLCRALGVDSGRMSRWLAGTGTPEPHVMLRIARYLDVPFEYLADPEQDTPPPSRAWVADVEKFIKVVGIDELYMRLYGVTDLASLPKVTGGDVSPTSPPPKPTSTRSPRRSGNS